MKFEACTFLDGLTLVASGNEEGTQFALSGCSINSFRAWVPSWVRLLVAHFLLAPNAVQAGKFRLG